MVLCTAGITDRRVLVRHWKIAAVAAAALSHPVSASDLVLGLGRDNIDDDKSDATVLQLEYHGNPMLEYGWGTISLFGAAEIDDDSDIYLGAGVSALWEVSEKWFVEGSLAGGYYDAGSDGNDLGGHVQFRTLIGVGVQLSDSRRISVAADHLSNAGLKDRNPGRNAIFLRYAISF